MTFSYAVIADGGIVLVADSQMTYSHLGSEGQVVGTYEGCRGKIKRIGARYAFSAAGNGGLIDTLVTKAELRGIDESCGFEKAVLEYHRAFMEEWCEKPRQLKPRAEAKFLFCGHIEETGKKIPQIVSLDTEANFLYNSVTGRGFAWSGATEHGAALYLHHRFYREEPLMPLEQAKLLAYCIAAEVAEQDNTVAGPIEMEVIEPRGSHALTDGEIRKYEKARQELVGKVRSYLADFL